MLDLVERIYGTVSGECDWQEVVDQFSRELPYSSVLLHCYDQNSNYTVSSLCQKWEIADVQKYAEYYSTISPWVSTHVHTEVGRVYTANQIVPNLDIHHPEFFHDFAKPAKIGAGAAIKLFDDDNLSGVITLDYKFVEAERYDELTVPILNQLAPHFERAIRLSSHLSMMGNERSYITESLERSDKSVFILDTTGRIVWSNQHANTEIDRGKDVYSIFDGKLRFRAKSGNVFLKKALLSELITTDGSVNKPHEIVVIPARDGLANDLLVTVTKLLGGYSRSSVVFSNHVAPKDHWLVSLTRRGHNNASNDLTIQQALGISGAEMRIISKLTQGLSVAEAAEALGISAHTARNQLKSALSKTDCKRQSELVLLIARMRKIL